MCHGVLGCTIIDSNIRQDAMTCHIIYHDVHVPVSYKTCYILQHTITIYIVPICEASTRGPRPRLCKLLSLSDDKLLGLEELEVSDALEFRGWGSVNFRLLGLRV